MNESSKHQAPNTKETANSKLQYGGVRPVTGVLNVARAGLPSHRSVRYAPPFIEIEISPRNATLHPAAVPPPALPARHRILTFIALTLVVAVLRHAHRPLRLRLDGECPGLRDLLKGIGRST